MANKDIDQYRQYLQNLNSEESRSAALNDIKDFIFHKPACEAISTMRNVGISKIVLCLDLKDKSQVELTCEVLKVCFEKFEVGEVVKNYTSYLMYLLRHEKSCVRSLALNEVYKTVTANKALMPIDQYIDVFVATAQLVSDEDVGIANTAIMITSHLPFEAYPKVLEEMKIALEYSSSSKCNALQVVANISSQSIELFNLCVEYGYIDFMMSELKSDDMLYNLNILELFTQIAIKPYGINYLIKNDGLKSIASYVEEMKGNPLYRLMIPGYMKFFGAVAHHYPREIIENYSSVLNCVFDSIESGDASVLPVAMDTLGFIGATCEGKLSLVAVGAKFTQSLGRVGQLLKNSETEIKVRALNCFASLISVNSTDQKVDHRVTLMTREWFQSLSNQPPAMNFLLLMCKSPFLDIKVAAFNLLEAVCQHQWGKQLIAKTAGFIEYLLDRSLEHTKELKEMKYEIIQKLSTSTAFDNEAIARLQFYVKEGPFYSATKLAIAMEEES